LTTKDLQRALLIIEHEAAKDRNPIRWVNIVAWLKNEIEMRLLRG